MIQYGGLYRGLTLERGSESDSSSDIENISFASARSNANYDVFIRSTGAISATVLISNKTVTGFTVTRLNPVALVYGAFEWVCIDAN